MYPIRRAEPRQVEHCRSVATSVDGLGNPYRYDHVRARWNGPSERWQGVSGEYETDRAWRCMGVKEIAVDRPCHLGDVSQVCGRCQSPTRRHFRIRHPRLLDPFRFQMSSDPSCFPKSPRWSSPWGSHLQEAIHFRSQEYAWVRGSEYARGGLATELC